LTKKNAPQRRERAKKDAKDSIQIFLLRVFLRRYRAISCFPGKIFRLKNQNEGRCAAVCREVYRFACNQQAAARLASAWLGGGARLDRPQLLVARKAINFKTQLTRSVDLIFYSGQQGIADPSS
jgi:hypothetical protein